MGTTTTNLGLTKPTPGDPTDRNVWGTTLNGNLDLLDAIFKSDGTGTSVGLNIGSGKTLAVSGTITVPTKTAGDNTTNAASTAFVQTALGSYVTTTSLTSTLSGYVTSTSLTSTLGSYAPLASPALTGNPTAPTQTAGDSSTKLATTEFVATALAGLAGLSSGAVVMHAGSTAPSGWYLCDGSAKNRTTDAALFAAIGTTFGAGNGSTTFNLPDMRGRFPAGVDNMGGTAANRLGSGVTGGITGTASLGATGGEQKHTLTSAEQASMSVSGSVSGVFSGSSDTGGNNAISNGNGTTPMGITGTASGGGGAHNNTPPVLVFNFIIKT